MRNIMLAAAGRNDWRRKIVIDLGISSNQVVNKINGQIATLPSGMTFSDTGDGYVALFNTSHLGGITLPHDADYAPGTGDFTMEAIIDVDGLYTEPADNSRIIPIASWGTWAAPGQTLNMDFLYNDLLGGGLSGGVFRGSASTRVTKYGVGLLTHSRYVHVAMQRRNGIAHLYQDSVLIHSEPYAENITPDVSGLFRIMSRRGGGTGNVWWRFIGKLKGFRLTHAAIYSGETIVPPSKF